MRTDRAPRAARIVQGNLDDAANADLARRLAAAREEGRRQGLAEAVGGAAAALARAADELEAARTRALEELPRTAIDLAVEIAGVLLRVEIAREHYDIETIVRDSLAWSGVGRGECSVHLHPDDARKLDDVPFRKLTAIEADEDVARGECHVTTSRGLLVREFDECLREVRAKLLAAAEEDER